MRIALYNVTSTMDAVGSGEVGGVEAYTFRLADALGKRGHDVTLFGGRPKSGQVFHPKGLSVVTAPYLETRSIPNWGTRFRRLIQRLHFSRSIRSQFDPTRFDVIMIFKPYDFIPARRWKKHLPGPRVLASIHGPELYPFDRRFSPFVDAFYAVSHDTAEAVSDRYGIPCPVIPNFLNLSEFPLMERSEPPAPRQILTVGRLVGWKGISHLIRAFGPISRSLPDVNLVIVGDGPEKKSLLAETHRLGLGERIRFTGILNAELIREEFSKSVLFVQPSIGYESFSISALEAIASGVRALLSDQVGLAKWFSTSESVTSYPARDEAALAKSLEKLLIEPWHVSRKSALEARRLVEEEFDASRIVSKIEELLKK